MAPTRALGAILASVITVLLSAGPAAASTSAYGHTGARDRVLRSSCHNYRYHYVVKAPTNDWVLETFLIDPTGQRLASGAFIAPQDPDRGRGHFRICRNTTVPGRFTIKAKLTWYDGYDEFTKRFDPSHFRLRRAS
jgi:hypothetical protein